MNSPAWLSGFRSDVFSQTGEDGVIQKVLEVIGETDKWCVEFGAADGIYFSNTRHLIKARGYSAVLIEADREQYERLRTLYSQDGRITTINACVGFTTGDGLDDFLAATPIPREFTLLSIDIDGNDYHVWKAVEAYSPRIVCIEFNPTIPTEVRFVQAAEPAVTQGSSLRALFELGRSKGYELVCVLPVNAIFVKRDYYHLFGIENNDPALLRTDVSDVTYLFSGYDGTVFLRGSRKLPWHRLDLKETRFQRLPRLVRRYPGRYGWFRKSAYILYVLWSEPKSFFRKCAARLQRILPGTARSDLVLGERHRPQDYNRRERGSDFRT